MNTRKYTPGPWRAALKDDSGPTSSEDPIEVACIPHGIYDALLVYSPKRGLSGTEHDGNAKLIAAAPDLLAACESAELVMTIVLPRSHMAEYTSALATVRAAIAKAKGT